MAAVVGNVAQLLFINRLPCAHPRSLAACHNGGRQLVVQPLLQPQAAEYRGGCRAMFLILCYDE